MKADPHNQSAIYKIYHTNDDCFFDCRARLGCRAMVTPTPPLASDAPRSTVTGVPKYSKFTAVIDYFAVNQFTEHNHFTDSNTTGDLSFASESNFKLNDFAAPHFADSNLAVTGESTAGISSHTVEGNFYATDFSVTKVNPHYCLDGVFRRSEARFCRPDPAAASIDARLAATFDETADLVEIDGDVAQWLQHMVE